MGTKINESKLDSFFQILSDELDARLKLGENHAARRLRSRMRKRAEYTRPELETLALDNFITLNNVVGTNPISVPQQIINDARYYITVILERFNTKLNELNIQETLDMSYLFSLWRFGPGASNGVKGTHVAEKINQKMTCTASCEPLVLQLRSTTPYFQHFDMLNDGGTTLMRGSRLTTVPKNEDTVRVIAIEPSGNMALQLAAGQYLTDVLRSVGLDIRYQQDLNKDLARVGSINNSLATIDLKSASDMFKPELIQLLLPTKWFELLMQIRSPYTNIKGTDVQLHMISTMGNGFTFPLMTLCIVALIYAFRASRNGPNLFIDWTNTAVFGDDIIIPSYEYTDFTILLEQAGLVVNHDKSYSDGPFRESCGGDFHCGVDITPFYVRSLAYDSDVFVATNQVLSWCGRNNYYLPKTLDYLRSLLKRVFFVPEWHSPDEGILTALVSGRYKYLSNVKSEVVLSNDNTFYTSLASGGYITSRGSHGCYIPRQFKTRYVVRKGRIPKGYLSGRCPLTRTDPHSATISLYISLSFDHLVESAV